MLAFFQTLFVGFVGFVKEFVKTLVIDTLVGVVLRPAGL